MNDKLLRFAEKRIQETNSETISLVISEVPSKVAYETLICALATNEDFSEEEIRRKVEARLNGTSLAITYPEFQRVITQNPSKTKEYYELIPAISDEFQRKVEVSETDYRHCDVITPSHRETDIELNDDGKSR